VYRRALVDAEGAEAAPGEQVQIDLTVAGEVADELHLVAEPQSDVVVLRRRHGHRVEILAKRPGAVVEPEARMVAGLSVVNVVDVEPSVAVEVGEPRPVRQVPRPERRAARRRRRLVGAIQADGERILRERDQWIRIGRVARQARRLVRQSFSVLAASDRQPKHHHETE